MNQGDVCVESKRNAKTIQHTPHILSNLACIRIFNNIVTPQKPLAVIWLLLTPGLYMRSSEYALPLWCLDTQHAKCIPLWVFGVTLCVGKPHRAQLTRKNNFTIDMLIQEREYYILVMLYIIYWFWVYVKHTAILPDGLSAKCKQLAPCIPQSKECRGLWNQIWVFDVLPMLQAPGTWYGVAITRCGCEKEECPTSSHPDSNSKSHSQLPGKQERKERGQKWWIPGEQGLRTIMGREA